MKAINVAKEGKKAYMFPPSVIERILTEVLQNSADKNEMARKFCFEDKKIYEEFLAYKNEGEQHENI